MKRLIGYCYKTYGFRRVTFLFYTSQNMNLQILKSYYFRTFHEHTLTGDSLTTDSEVYTTALLVYCSYGIKKYKGVIRSLSFMQSRAFSAPILTNINLF